MFHPARLLSRLGGALVCFLLLTQSLWAESPLRTLVRDATVRGLPPLEIDLDAVSTQRYALVVGNSDYIAAETLPNASADARLVAQLLRKAGFTVSEHYDLDKRGFESALREALYDIEFGAEFFFYYAGHGVQIGDGNYLIPTDMQLGTAYDVPLSTVSLDSVMAVTGTRTRSMTVVLDSCRNNPFPDLAGAVTLDGTPYELQSGFTAPETPINSLLIFSTSPGSLALDGEGANSPFTRAFVDALTAEPERPIDEVMKDVRRRVYRDTNKLQVPWASSSLVEPITLGMLNQDQTALPAAEFGAPLKVRGMLDRNVPLSQNLQMEYADLKGLALLGAPRTGRLDVRKNGKITALPSQRFVPEADMSSIVYTAQFKGQFQSGVTMQNRLQDEFRLQLGGRVHEVRLDLEIDPCDLAAGDHLDPESVGIARYPNELEPLDALDACEAAVVRAPQTGRFHYQKGRALLALKRFDAARGAFQTAAELGHTRAHHGMGSLAVAQQQITTGQTRQAATDDAMAHFLTGVRRGDPYAYHSMGLQLLQFPRVPSDQRSGFELLSRAVELGHTFSMNALGLYFLKEGSPHYDAARGLRYLQESAARGDIYGFANLGYAALNGVAGRDVDLTAAEGWYRKAARGGHPTAATALGRMYLRGQINGVPEYDAAMSWYDIGLNRGDGWGGANGAWVILNKRPDGFSQFDAAERAAKAARLGNPQAASEASAILSRLPRSVIDGAAQQIIVQLGSSVIADGAFGPASRKALRQIETEFQRRLPEDPLERLLGLAALYWETTKFRVDLY